MQWGWFQRRALDDRILADVKHTGRSFATRDEARADLLRHLNSHYG